MKQTVLMCPVCLDILGCLEDEIYPCWGCEEEVCFAQSDDVVTVEIPNHVCEGGCGHA